MTTLILQHDDCRYHNPGMHHPERPQRIAAAVAGLEGIAGLERLPAPLATPEQVARAHPLEHLDFLTDSEPDEHCVALDGDTMMSPGSLNAALRSSGSVCFAIDEILLGRVRNAFCLTRPPGHHAESATAMGFCLLNHVAVGARHALAQEGIERVAIVDFDVHHGNGTQEIFAESPEVMYLSSHEMPLFPGTGYADETGCGNILNMPLSAGAGSAEFRHAWTTLGLPALHSFAPDMILVSAGFDGHERDPLAQLSLQAADFAWITREIAAYAREACSDRVVSTLEGGYDLEALGISVNAHVRELAAFADLD